MKHARVVYQNHVVNAIENEGALLHLSPTPHGAPCMHMHMHMDAHAHVPTLQQQ